MRIINIKSVEQPKQRRNLKWELTYEKKISKNTYHELSCSKRNVPTINKGSDLVKENSRAPLLHYDVNIRAVLCA